MGIYYNINNASFISRVSIIHKYNMIKNFYNYWVHKKNPIKISQLTL